MKNKVTFGSYFAPTPKLFRKIGDSFLLIGSTISSYAIYEDYKAMAIIAVASTVLGKLITNFFSEINE